MTIYATQSDFVARFGAEETLGLCTTVASGEAAIDSAALGVALNDASRVVDSYIAIRYPLDLIAARSAFPEPLRLAVCDITRYFLYKDQATEQVSTRYKEQIAWLRDVSKGVVALVFSPPLTVAEQQEAIFAPAPVVGADLGGVFGASVLSGMPEVCRRDDPRFTVVNGVVVRLF